MMAHILKLRLYGDSCLRKKSKEVEDVGPSERMLIKSMVETMHAEKGVGLAAPQVGINQQIFVADIGEGPMAFINPRIVKKWGASTLEEGCLSIPGVVIKIKRPKKILVQYRDVSNVRHEKTFDELLARVIQHETDHLNGKLIIDHASLTEKLKWREVLAAIKRLGAKPFKPKAKTEKD